MIVVHVCLVHGMLELYSRHCYCSNVCILYTNAVLDDLFAYLCKAEYSVRLTL